MYPYNFDNAGSYYSNNSAILDPRELPNGYPSMIPPQVPAVGEPLDVYGTPSFQPVAGAASYASGSGGYDQPLPPNYYWPAVHQQPQPQPRYAGPLGWNTTIAGSTMMPKASTFLPAPSTAPFHYWGDNQNGSATAFDWDVYTSNQLTSGPSRIGQSAPLRRYQPYGASRARRGTGHQNAEAGPSTLVPPQAQNVGLPTSEPSGGSIPETTADAEEKQTTTEEAGAPVQEKVRCPRGEGKLRPGRVGLQNDKGRLCGLVKEWKSLRAEPSTVVALEATLEYIPTVRAEVYPEPQLETGKTQPRPAGGRRLTEWLRRREERKLLGQLSRFYQLPPSEPSGEQKRKGEKKKEKGWTAPSLLREVLEDLEVRYPPPELSASEPLTPTVADS